MASVNIVVNPQESYVRETPWRGLGTKMQEALTWADIDYVNQALHITKTISRNDEGYYIVGSPKRKSSRC